MILRRKFVRKCVNLSLLIFIYFMIYVVVSHIWQTEKNSESATDAEKISWENLSWISYEKNRTGPGEQGLAYHESDKTLRKKNKNWEKEEGFFVEVSNKISLNRALPDLRPRVCSDKKYLKVLPKASVIITFYNEFWSTLLRCVHSVYNRSPRELLHEIVLINDNSTKPELYEELKKYVRENFGEVVKIHENKKREGLIKSRMIGAEITSAEVIIFLDSHMEVYNSWLPPLLDPLISNPTFATVPICDGINPRTFKTEDSGNGNRGMFDWNLRFQWIPLRPEDMRGEAEPHETPCLTGGHYAIRRDHFLHLGGYDEGLKIWNGENFELCIKLWLCSGGILEIPCSRVAHLSKSNGVEYGLGDGEDPHLSNRNLKRVAEVWLDDYKKYFYQSDPEHFKNLDHGDISKQLLKKKELNCKPFTYFLDVVAPDMLLRFPAPKRYFADGKIMLEEGSNCLGIAKGDFSKPISFLDCNSELGVNWTLTLERSIRFDDYNDQCLEFNNLKVFNCHHMFSNQFWKFDIKSRLITNIRNQCLSADVESGKIFLAKCENLPSQKWKWSSENQTALENWETTGVLMT